jgi:hypothetical protein
MHHRRGLRAKSAALSGKVQKLSGRYIKTGRIRLYFNKAQI